MSRRRVLVTAAVTLLAGASLAACSGGDDGGKASADHNAADTEFAQMMIVHHEGAVEMAGLASEKATDPEVKALAGRIAGAQQPEIDTMTGWLEAWGEETDAAGTEMEGMDHSGMDMEGMSQEEAMASLSELSGAEFDMEFLHLMIAHHEGAVEMSETELADGQNPEAKELAQTIIDAQTAEIAEMEELMGGAM
ncbi:DUF305 domain-containing protein [Myceligenerans crystallogenes]|uniref:DUF305 domain-containing protein n=1 Tax=Myceligenerans crystallogenes TaxID=316335 RepID=A0ABN2NGH9_9MICO